MDLSRLLHRGSETQRRSSGSGSGSHKRPVPAKIKIGSCSGYRSSREDSSPPESATTPSHLGSPHSIATISNSPTMPGLNSARGLTLPSIQDLMDVADVSPYRNPHGVHNDRYATAHKTTVVRKVYSPEHDSQVYAHSSTSSPSPPRARYRATSNSDPGPRLYESYGRRHGDSASEQLRSPRPISQPRDDASQYSSLASSRSRADSGYSSHSVYTAPSSASYSSPHEASLPVSRNLSPVDQGNPWLQHHHYIAPSASTALANQQADRYICPTCNKAFSRPSSLRIHGHSHTGEKPFRCSQMGCGKAFSVRSNMKRHERGCHGGDDLGSP